MWPEPEEPPTWKSELILIVLAILLVIGLMSFFYGIFGVSR